MALPPKVYTFLCGCFAAFGSFTFGYDLGVIAGVLTAPDFLRVTNLQGTDNETSNYLGFIASSMVLGAFCACVPTSLIADKLSRRTAIVNSAAIFTFGAILQAAAQNREMMMAGRFITGLGIGGLTMLAPLYQSEIAHPSMRGSLTTLQQLFLGIGAFIASLSNYGLLIHHLDTPFQWRFALALQIAPAIPLLTCMFLLPESPRWYMLKGRREDAHRTLARLHASDQLEHPFVLAQMIELEAAVQRDTEAERVHGGWMSLINNRQTFRKVLLGVILQFSVQMTGVSAIQYFSPTIFKVFGFSVRRSLLFNSIANVFALVGEICAVLFVDQVGRRTPLIGCNIGSGITFVIGTALMAIYPATNANNNKSAAYAFVVMTWLFQWFFSFGIGPLSWTYPVEIFSTGMRARGTAVTTMSSYISNFMIGQVSPIAFKNVGWRYYLLFAICGFTNALTVYLLFPETKGRTLEEMDLYMEQMPWIVVGTSKALEISAKEREVQLKRGIVHDGIGEGTYGEVPTLKRKQGDVENTPDEKK
ncbi:general substrate transporter [Meira miltonrushii]|uniref:General substrate transporter n=1 Tax=Meira miltonrushii TaxID=1280837 RepID=A0A316VFI8_9BASI|nr:general substrate transporter [Meira miltonrushii]PWN36397.1 general substrate transporter [Meira miltonrushii]